MFVSRVDVSRRKSAWGVASHARVVVGDGVRVPDARAVRHCADGERTLPFGAPCAVQDEAGALSRLLGDQRERLLRVRQAGQLSIPRARDRCACAVGRGQTQSDRALRFRTRRDDLAARRRSRTVAARRRRLSGAARLLRGDRLLLRRKRRLFAHDPPPGDDLGGADRGARAGGDQIAVRLIVALCGDRNVDVRAQERLQSGRADEAALCLLPRGGGLSARAHAVRNAVRVGGERR